jgi:type II restriction enzyme
MNLTLNTNLALPYKSRSQIARVLTESWFEDNMYCPACPSNSLDRLMANTKVLDFQCPKCEETYQVKSKSGKFYNTIANSEYHTKIEKIKKGLSPNWALVQYDPMEYKVTDLMIIPGHFMTLNAVQPRKPLSKSARRAGWVGSNILMNKLPPDAKLYVIEEGLIVPKINVRKVWKRFEFFKEKQLREKGWLNDILTCVRKLDKKEFTLKEMYGFEERLQELHPNNKHVKEKIRQQLQVLRDEGIIKFVSRGHYCLIS